MTDQPPQPESRSRARSGETARELIRKVIGTGGSIQGIRFSQNAINGHFIEDAYIYRIL